MSKSVDAGEGNSIESSAEYRQLQCTSCRTDLHSAPRPDGFQNRSSHHARRNRLPSSALSTSFPSSYSYPSIISQPEGCTGHRTAAVGPTVSGAYSGVLIGASRDHIYHRKRSLSVLCTEQPNKAASLRLSQIPRGVQITCRTRMVTRIYEQRGSSSAVIGG
ncbi:hypothetical protein BDW22DRAFT_338555 [Trametopsis cervina]|nr:hypothetical protein BDW22DRAFT_338555 [Trametopsis cervina]